MFYILLSLKVVVDLYCCQQQQQLPLLSHGCIQQQP